MVRLPDFGGIGVMLLEHVPIEAVAAFPCPYFFLLVGLLYSHCLPKFNRVWCRYCFRHEQCLEMFNGKSKILFASMLLLKETSLPFVDQFWRLLERELLFRGKHMTRCCYSLTYLSLYSRSILQMFFLLCLSLFPTHQHRRPKPISNSFRRVFQKRQNCQTN